MSTVHAMLPSVLGSLTLGYQLVWNRFRQPVAVHLFVDLLPDTRVDATHLLATLGQAWSEQSPVLLLSVHPAALLLDLLQQAAPDGPWIVVPQQLALDPQFADPVRSALQRGVPLLWRGEPGQHPSAALAQGFVRAMATLEPGQALLALRAAQEMRNDGAGEVVADQIYETVATRMLAEHCLDRQGAWGVAGWPTDDVAYAYRQQEIQPSQDAIGRLVETIDADAAMEVIENTLAEEPVLTYRFLRFANSPAVGLRDGVDSLRHGLMVLGLSRCRNWLLEQLPHASSDMNLQPVRTALVVRARLTEQLLDAGDEDKLRREVFLCGLFSQIDLLLGEPLADALQKLPVSERITDAIGRNTGPYAPFLEIATALEYPNMAAVNTLCERHEIDPADVNLAVLRVLAHVQPHAAKGRLPY